MIDLCGIVGITSDGKFSIKKVLIPALKRLEYRGYDSSGFATSSGICKKAIGDIENLYSKIKRNIRASTAIAHTRWATHGGVTVRNAHPHTDYEKKLYLVHNGIIENHLELKQELEQNGYEFKTETDTEVIANYLNCQLKKKNPVAAIRSFMEKAEGTYAVAFVILGSNKIYAFKKDSPLCIGVAGDKAIVASDIYAFSHLTDRVVFLDDYEIAELTPKNIKFFNLNKELNKQPTKIRWETKTVQKQRFSHFMLKEIMEQPSAIKRIIASLENDQAVRVNKIAELIKTSKRVLFLACGTSYHASLVGTYLLTRLGYEAHAVIASEFENFSLIDKDTLVFAVSQSGETMDVITVLKNIKDKVGKLVAIINIPCSTIHRMSDTYLEIKAGQEICVAATKTFTNTLIALFKLAWLLGNSLKLTSIPDKVSFTLKNNKQRIKRLAKRLQHHRDIFVLGNKVSYPISREIALKLKEISYVHAEGMMAGELKHGTIALIEKDVPVIGLAHDSNRDRMESALKEVEARGASVFRIDNQGNDFYLPRVLREEEYAVCSNVIGQMLAYYIALNKGLPIDKPRNLAKSVTVK